MTRVSRQTAAMHAGPVRRYEDWPARLGEFLAARRALPFAWGANDCCTFAADAVLAMTGIDPARGRRGYKTARGATGRLNRAGGGVDGIAEAAAAGHGWPEIAPGFAARGDVAVLETELGPTLAVVDLNGRELLCPGPHGLAAYPAARARRAWRIG